MKIRIRHTFLLGLMLAAAPLSFAPVSVFARSSSPATTLADIPVSLPVIVAVAAAGTIALAGIIGGAWYFSKNKKGAAPKAGTQANSTNTAQLQQAYGNITKYMTNTPEPNLGGGFADSSHPVAGETSPEAAPQAAALPVAPAAAVDLSQQRVSDMPELPVAASPRLAPLSPAVSAPNAQNLADTPTVPVEPFLPEQPTTLPSSPAETAPPPLEADTLEQELAKVESSEPTISRDEPSAIYDASTGELDIIHRHGHVTAAASAARTTDTSSTTLGTPTQQGTG